MAKSETHNPNQDADKSRVSSGNPQPTSGKMTPETDPDDKDAGPINEAGSGLPKDDGPGLVNMGKA